MRVSEQFLRMLDDWRRTQIDLPSRAEAIRRLVEFRDQNQQEARRRSLMGQSSIMTVGRTRIVLLSNGDIFSCNTVWEMRSL